MNELPDEIIWSISLFLENFSNFMLLTNKRFYNITKNDIYWKELFCISFHNGYPKCLAKKDKWKEKYKWFLQEINKYTHDVLSDKIVPFLKPKKLQNKDFKRYNNDEIFMFEMVKRDFHQSYTQVYMRYVSKHLKNHPVFMKLVTEKDPNLLKYASQKIKNNKELVLAMVKKEGWSLCFAGQKLKNDKEVVLEAVKNDPAALTHASPRLRNDKDIALLAMKNTDRLLYFVGDEIKNNKEIVLKVVKNNGDQLQYASDNLQDDKEVVLAAIENDRYAFEWTSERLRNDEDVVFAATRNGGYALLYGAGTKFKEKYDVYNCGISRMVSDNIMIKTYKRALCRVKEVGSNLQLVIEELRVNKDIVLAAVENDGRALLFASDNMKNDKEVVLAAVKQHGESIKWASKKLKNDKEILEGALNNVKQRILKFI